MTAPDNIASRHENPCARPGCINQYPATPAAGPGSTAPPPAAPPRTVTPTPKPDNPCTSKSITARPAAAADPPDMSGSSGYTAEHAKSPSPSVSDGPPPNTSHAKSAS